jgi:hypothetical protein
MSEKDVPNRRTRPTQLGHEFEAPIVKEVPGELRHSERERGQTTSNQSDATLSETSTEKSRSAARDAQAPRS